MLTNKMQQKIMGLETLFFLHDCKIECLSDQAINRDIITVKAAVFIKPIAISFCMSSIVSESASTPFDK